MSDSRMTDSRLAEKLIALLRYEMEDGRGCCAEELIDEVIVDTRTAIVNQFDGPEDLTDEQCEKITRETLVLADHLVMVLVETGHADAAEKTIEHIANRRRECDAKFGSPRSVPFSTEEREKLASQWGKSSAEVA